MTHILDHLFKLTHSSSLNNWNVYLFRVKNNQCKRIKVSHYVSRFTWENCVSCWLNCFSESAGTHSSFKNSQEANWNPESSQNRMEENLNISPNIRVSSFGKSQNVKSKKLQSSVPSGMIIWYYLTNSACVHQNSRILINLRVHVT